MNSLSAKILSGAENLHPAYFALVMATGIVSIAALFLEFHILARGLFWINLLAYAVLWALTLIRLIRYPAAFRRDLFDHNRGPGFFTIVAGTCVLGNQFVFLLENFTIAFYLWVLGGAIWLVLIYTFFTAVTVKEEKPGLEKGINGSWLITIVATQSVSILGALLGPSYGQNSQTWYFLMLALFLIGCMLYILVIALIFYRFIFFRLTPGELTQPYWINMGAVAITTLAGATLMHQSSHFLFLQEIMPFMKGFTLFFWAFGTWWIPLLFIFGYWRHIYKKFSFRYDPQYWGMVFPLGMYTVCTFRLSQVLDLALLMWIPRYFIYIALVAWAGSFGSLLYELTINIISHKTKGAAVSWKQEKIS